MPMTNLTGVPSVWNDLGLSEPQAMSEQDRLKRKKKIMSAAETASDPMARYGSAAAMLLGARGANAPM